MKKPRSTKDSEVRSDVIHQRATNVGRGFFTRLEYTSLEEHIPAEKQQESTFEAGWSTPRWRNTYPLYPL